MSIEIYKRKRATVYRVRMMRDSRSVCRSFKRKQDAMVFEKDVLLNSALVNTKEYTFKEAAEEWLKRHAEVRKLGSGVLMDRIMLKNNANPHIGHLKIGRMQPTHIEDEFIAKLLEKGLNKSTINRNLCVVRAIFNFCKRRHMIYRNPMDEVSNLDVDERDFKYWSLKDAKTFLECTKKKYANGRYTTYLLYLVALNTGMRLGELLALQWQDVDFENRIITVRRSYCSYERRVRETTKSRKIRHIPINSAIFNELYEAYRARAECQLVFHWNGSVVHPSNLRTRYFEKDMRESGVARIRIHDMRHTFASHYMMNGGNPYDLQKILGHSSLRMTERYTHLSKAFLASKGDVVSFSSNENVIHANFATRG